MTVQQRRREQHQVRREVAREHGAQQGEPPTSGAERTQLRQPPFTERREVAADPHHRVRTSRAAYAPSTAWCCGRVWKDRKSTRLNSSHTVISYAVFCLKKKKTRSIRDVRG